MSLRQEVERASAFVRPLLSDDANTLGDTILVTLNDSSVPLRNANNIELASRFLRDSLESLSRIHHAAVADSFNSGSIYDGDLMSSVYALLDLIATQWLLPTLSPGVAFQHRPKSIITVPITPMVIPRRETLTLILQCWTRIIDIKNVGIEPILSQRCLPDFTACLAELAFCPEFTEDVDTVNRQLFFAEFLDKTPTSRLLPLLTTYASQRTPAWLRPQLSKPLSLLPLRPRGIRQILEYIAVSHQSDGGGTSSSSNDPSMTLGIIQQATKLLSGTPSSMSQDEWIAGLAPQLLDMLDGKDGEGLIAAAGHIISAGFLSKKTSGSPGSAGHEAFVAPLHCTIYPRPAANLQSLDLTTVGTLVDEVYLWGALERLQAIASAYPNPGVIKRLVGPIRVPLWGLLCYAKSPKDKVFIRGKWIETVQGVLRRYLELAADDVQLDSIARDLMWDGTEDWTFAPGSDGGIAIRQRIKGAVNPVELFGQISLVESRASLFASLLSGSNISYEASSALFMRVSERWLNPKSEAQPSLLGPEEVNPLNIFVNAQLTNALIQKFEKLTEDPRPLLTLINKILSGSMAELTRSDRSVTSLSRSGLANIIPQSTHEPSQSGMSDGVDAEELLTPALSLLDHVLRTSKSVKNSRSSIMADIHLNLQKLYANKSRLSASLVDNISDTLDSLKQIDVIGPQPSDTSAQSEWGKAITDLSDAEAPNRAAALVKIRHILSAGTTRVDPTQTALQLLHTLRADNDSFVFLPCIRALVALLQAQERPHFIARIVLDAFLDIKEDAEGGLDARLRIGELLAAYTTAGIVEKTPPESSAENLALARRSRFNALSSMTEACLTLASRRGNRPKTFDARKSKAESIKIKQEADRAAALEAWGGDIPTVDPILIDPSFEPENDNERLEREYLEKIVRGWEDIGVEEDVRLRTSALSVLSLLFEKYLEVETASTLVAALEIATSVLVLEYEPGREILRRAAAIVVMSVLRRIDSFLEAKDIKSADKLLEIGKQKWPEVERVVQWVASEDGDEITKGHTQAIIEGLETLKLKRVMQGSEEEEDAVKAIAEGGLQGGLRGLNVQPNVSERKSGIIEEVE